VPVESGHVLTQVITDYGKASVRILRVACRASGRASEVSSELSQEHGIALRFWRMERRNSAGHALDSAEPRGGHEPASTGPGGIHRPTKTNCDVRSSRSARGDRSRGARRRGALDRIDETLVLSCAGRRGVEQSLLLHRSRGEILLDNSIREHSAAEEPFLTRHRRPGRSRRRGARAPRGAALGRNLINRPNAVTGRQAVLCAAPEGFSPDAGISTTSKQATDIAHWRD